MKTKFPFKIDYSRLKKIVTARNTKEHMEFHERRRINKPVKHLATSGRTCQRVNLIKIKP